MIDEEGFSIFEQDDPVDDLFEEMKGELTYFDSYLNMKSNVTETGASLDSSGAVSSDSSKSSLSCAPLCSPAAPTVSSPHTPVSSFKESKVARRVLTPGSFCFDDIVEKLPTEITEPEDTSVDVPETEKVNQHTEPNWLLDLTSKFTEKIVEECSGKAKAAVKKNEVIKVRS